MRAGALFCVADLPPRMEWCERRLRPGLNLPRGSYFPGMQMEGCSYLLKRGYRQGLSDTVLSFCCFWWLIVYVLPCSSSPGRLSLRWRWRCPGGPQTWTWWVEFH